MGGRFLELSMSDAFPRPEAATAPTWSDPLRQQRFEQWLAELAPSHGLDLSSLRVASADASFRRYLRVDAAPPARSFVVMDAPAPQENTEPFVRIARLLQAAGLRVPTVHAWDEAQGFVLLEDFGDAVLIRSLQSERPAAALPGLRVAIAELVRLQTASRAGVLPPYDAALLRRELQLFPDWYVGQHRQMQLSPQQSAVLTQAFDILVERNLASPSVYVHRDFMPRNLMCLPQEPDRLGVLDFQDAVYGPITYDIASLMRDAFLSWDEQVVIDVTARYWEAARKANLPVDADFGEFYRGVEWMGLQRHLKVAGIFARLSLRDGKEKYLADTPRFIGYILHGASRYRELVPLARLVEQIEGTQTAQGWAFGRVG